MSEGSEWGWSFLYIFFREDQRLTRAQCAILRSELNILRAKLEDSESQKENYHSALLEAESRLERSKSATVREMEIRVPLKSQEAQSEEKEEVQRKPSSPVVSGPVIG